MGHISKSIWPTNFILGTRLHHSEWHVKIYMTLTQGQGHRGQPKVTKIIKKINKIEEMGQFKKVFDIHALYLASSYDIMTCIIWTEIPWPWSKVKDTGQGQVFKNCPKTKQCTSSHLLFHSQTSYLVPSYNPIRHIWWSRWQWPWQKVKVTGQGQIST